MCGRFALTLPSDAMAQLFEASPANNLPNLPGYNICPTTPVHVIRSGPMGRQLVAMRWGFVPTWYKSPSDGPLLINARAETIAEKPAFAMACRSQRCLIPADGFYEWTKSESGARLPWYIERHDQAPIAFAGIWQSWGAAETTVATCAIVTTAANGDLDPIHHRMPLMLDPENWAKWLGEAGHGAAALMEPGPEGLYHAFRVDCEVNSNRAQGPQLRNPVDPNAPPRGQLI